MANRNRLVWLGIGVAAVALSACSAAPAAAPTSQGSTPTTPAAATTAPVAPTQAPASTSAPTAAVTTAPTAAVTTSATLVPTAPPPTKGTAQVDLTFSGTKDFTAKGTAGRCVLIYNADGSVKSFGFEGTETDYPGLGLSFSLAQLQPGYVDIKWVLNDQYDSYARPGPAQGGSNVMTLSSDGKTLTINVDLAGLHAQGRPDPGPENVSGTITCP